MTTIIQVGREDLKHELLSILSDFQAEADKRAEERAKDMLLTPDEVCGILKITAVSLWRYDKAQYLHPLYIGGKKRYRNSEIQGIIEKGGATK